MLMTRAGNLGIMFLVGGVIWKKESDQERRIVEIAGVRI